ncbi:hypothetical protein GBA65_10365 [Rubrobacter marinus]|uniref:Uncharacterized protein n=1 Tax=Rubrobacter marinus TaxID=2653852 RepID=A0A6G8PXG8_9ACTN|nr:hypothetical protein [Rubrobacter marinus]QIN78858.1 hypothetical protein GBA65_10365 [Rubrobacter marinus]
MTTVPSPSVASDETYAIGCMAVKKLAPNPRTELAILNRAALSVTATMTCTSSTESMLFNIPTSPSTGKPRT